MSTDVTPPAPAILDKVRAATRSAVLRRVRASARPMPDATSPIVLAVVRNEIARLPTLLRHHREIGVERFVFIDNDSNDGTAEFLHEQPDIDLFAADAPFSWVTKQGWLNAAVDAIGRDRWYLSLDADERLVFDGSSVRDVGQLAQLAEGMGLHRVRGLLLDLYPDGPLLHPVGDPSATLFDVAEYREHAVPEMLSVRGGVRARVFGAAHADFRPELTKYPLFRVGADEVLENPHYPWPYPANFLSPRLVALLHDKFSGGFAARMADALHRNVYWNDSLEYRCYQDVLARQPDLALPGEQSRRYTGPEQLVALGLIAPLNWPAPGVTPADRMRAATRRSLAALLEAGEFADVSAQPDAQGPTPAANCIGPVKLCQHFRLTGGYAHLDVLVDSIRHNGTIWPPMRFKLAQHDGAPRLEFRDAPDWPVMFDPWPGQAQDRHGRLFRVSEAELGAVASRLGGTQPGDALAALVACLPPIVDAALRQTEPDEPAVDWMGLAAAIGTAWAEAQPRSANSQPPFSTVSVNQVFADSGDYAHLDISVRDLHIADRSWPELRFKISHNRGTALVEFRRLAGWPTVFDPWPASTTDRHGDYLRVGPEQVERLLATLAGRPERQAVQHVFALMPQIVAAALAAAQIDDQTSSQTWDRTAGLFKAEAGL